MFVTGDAYVDHPSFAMAILGRVLEAAGFRVAIVSQPDWHSCDDWRRFGRPRLFFAISAGNMDSMINHYTANRKVRNDDAYSPGGRIGLRPDRATLAYCQRAPRSLQGRAGDRRRRRGLAAATGPLRLLERQGPPLDPAGLQGRPAGVRHGRERDRRDRAAAGGGRDGARPARHARCGLCAGRVRDAAGRRAGAPQLRSRCVATSGRLPKPRG